MDLFGIGVAMEGMVRMYIQTSRACGRTTSMVNSLKDGDRVIFTNNVEAERVAMMCRDKGIKITCKVITPRAVNRIFEEPPSKGRTIFDHSWVEQYYLNAVQSAGEEIQHLETESGGRGEAHEKTRRQAMEICKWKGF